MYSREVKLARASSASASSITVPIISPFAVEGRKRLRIWSLSASYRTHAGSPSHIRTIVENEDGIEKLRLQQSIPATGTGAFSMIFPDGLIVSPIPADLGPAMQVVYSLRTTTGSLVTASDFYGQVTYSWV